MPEFALWQQNVAYPARQDRVLVSELLGEGVIDIAGGSLLVTERSAGANMSVDVAAGRCVVAGDEQADQETYLVAFDDATNLTVASADPDQARTDRVIVRVADSAVSGSTDGPIREVLTGTPGSGSAPAVPDSAISIAIVDVPAGANSITDNEITDDRSRTSQFPRSHGASDHDATVSDNPHGAGDHDSSVADDPHGSGTHDSSVATNPHGPGEHSSDVATNPHGNEEHDGTFAQIETGSYTGDGTTGRTISTSFTPKQVTINSEELVSSGDGAVGWLTNQTHNWVLENGGGASRSTDFVIVSGGFQVNGSRFMNADTVGYSWVAWA